MGGACPLRCSRIIVFPTIAWWLVALIVAAVLLAATSFTTRDADSRVYITIASRLSVGAAEPMDRAAVVGRVGHAGALPRAPDRHVRPAGASWPRRLSADSGLVRDHAGAADREPVDVRRAGVAAGAGLLQRGRWPGRCSSFRSPSSSGSARTRNICCSPVCSSRSSASIARAVVRRGCIVALSGYLYALLVKGVFAFLAPVCGAFWIAASDRTRQVNAASRRGWASR